MMILIHKLEGCWLEEVELDKRHKFLQSTKDCNIMLADACIDDVNKEYNTKLTAKKAIIESLRITRR